MLVRGGYSPPLGLTEQESKDEMIRRDEAHKPPFLRLYEKLINPQPTMLKEECDAVGFDIYD